MNVPETIALVADAVAEAARDLGAPFLGMPASWPWGHQRRDMEALGVPFLIDHLSDVTPALLAACDHRASNTYWETP